MSKKRHKNRNRYNKVLVIGPFANDEHLRIYEYVIGKYGVAQAAEMAIDKADNHDSKDINMPEDIALQILEAEDGGNDPRVRVEDVTYDVDYGDDE